MGLIRKIFGRSDSRAVTSDPYLAEYFGQNVSTLAHVDIRRASGTAVAHRCISLTAKQMTGVSLLVYGTVSVERLRYAVTIAVKLVAPRAVAQLPHSFGPSLNRSGYQA